jgi:hypothetical protein
MTTGLLMAETTLFSNFVDTWHRRRMKKKKNKPTLELPHNAQSQTTAT